MRILYAIQATGNGHVSRAKTLIPYLQKNYEVDVLLSGTSSDIELGHPITYKYKGLSFVFGKNGGVNFWQTIRQINFWRFVRDVKQLSLKDYDFVINDFEPVSAWACKFKGKHCVALSHQYSLLSRNAPRPQEKNILSELILRYYAPTSIGYGLHFKKYDSNVYLPIIKEEIRTKNPTKKNFYLVYLPSFADEKIISVLNKIYNINWIIFSKHTQKKYQIGNIKVYPISSEFFNNKLVECKGVLCGAGFETPSEALFLKKKLMVIPMKNQYEQQCNAVSLKNMGVQVIYDLNHDMIEVIQNWTKSKKIINVDYQESPKKVLNRVLIDYMKKTAKNELLEEYIY